MTHPHPKISAVLIHKENEPYPEIVLERLDINDFFDEIIIVNDCPSVYHRYLAAQRAKNDIIYVQDSDCMLNAFHLFKFYDGRITNAMTKDFIKKYENLECTLIGWGCYFDKSALSCFDKYVAKYGVDQTLLREADRVFTAMNKPWNTVIMPHEDLASSKTPDRMGYQENHYQSMAEALEKCKALMTEWTEVQVLEAFANELLDKAPSSSSDIKALFEDVCVVRNMPTGKVLPMLRMAITGEKKGPDLMSTIEIIEAKEAANRIQTYLK